MEELRVIAAHAIDRCSQNGRSDWSVLKANIKNDLSGYLFKTTKRNPMILPVIMERSEPKAGRKYGASCLKKKKRKNFKTACQKKRVCGI